MTPNQPTIEAASGFIAAATHDAERAIDQTLIRLGELFQSVPGGRLDAGVAAEFGQKALEQLVEAMASGVKMRGQVVRTHRLLSCDGKRLGVDVTVLTGGDLKPADDGTIAKPAGRLTELA